MTALGHGRKISLRANRVALPQTADIDYGREDFSVGPIPDNGRTRGSRASHERIRWRGIAGSRPALGPALDLIVTRHAFVAFDSPVPKWARKRLPLKGAWSLEVELWVEIASSVEACKRLVLSPVSSRD
jgi:hypothetical protein